LLLGVEPSTVAHQLDPMSGRLTVREPIDGFTPERFLKIPVAVVHAPVTGQTWTAVRGGGAFLDGTAVSTTTCAQLDTALIATGFGYRAERRASQAAVVAQVLPLVRDIRRCGAASLDLCEVACGRLDGYYEQGLQRWDLAAGGLIVREAGGLVSGLNGRPASEAMTVAAGPALHPHLVDLLTALDADRPS